MLARTLRRGLLAGAAAAALLPLAATAAPPKVTIVVAARAKEKQAYLDKLSAYEAATERLGLPRARVWRATLAGEGTDLIYVATEYESSAAWGAAQQKTAADPEASRLLREIEASGVRTVVSRSLLVEEALK